MTIGGRVRHTAIVTLLAVAVGSAATASRAVAAPAVRLSDERLVTRWAHPERLGWVRAAPTVRARKLVRLHRLTEDGAPEVYLALRTTRDRAGRPWVELRLPRRPNGSKGWVPRVDLGPLRIVRTALEIDRRRLRATLRRNGRVVWRARVGVGAPGTPTPAGRFYVREKLPNLRGDPLYGPWAIGTSAYSRLSEWPGGGVIGIHGTNQPALIPGRPSHGCIRLTNAAIRALVRQLPLGTPIRVR